MASPRARVVKAAPSLSRTINYLTQDEAHGVREKKQVIIDREFDRMHKAGLTIDTQTVLESASKPESPLHRFFDWDDSRAAKKWREHQALQLIMASKMVAVLQASAGTPPKAYSSRTEVRRLVNPFRGEGFKMRNEAMQNDEMRTALVSRKVTQLRRWLDSVVDFTELDALREKILIELNTLTDALGLEEVAVS